MSPGTETIGAVGAGPILVLLLLAAGSALFLARVYRETGHRATGIDLRRAFPLIAVALTALFVTVQVSLPMSLGLLAALTITRFRTPVKEPEEIALVMATVSVAAMLATLRLSLAGVLLAATVPAALLTRSLRRGSAQVSGLLVVSMPSSDLQPGAIPGLRLPGCRLQSVSVAAAEAVLSFRFAAASESRIRAVERDVIRRLPLARATVVVDAPPTLS